MIYQSIYKIVLLGEVACFINGDRSTNYPKGDDYVDEGIPFISAADLAEGRIDISSVRKISQNAFDRLRSGKIQEYDVLFCLRGSIGKIARIRKNEHGAIASSLVIVRATEKVKPLYLYFYLSSQAGQQAALGLNNGAAQPNLSVSELQKISFPLPPLPIQRRIAGILSAYDDLIENNQRRIAILETMARSLYREWFVHYRYPGHEAVPLVDSPLGPIPQGWEVRKLGEVADTFRGRSYRSVDLADEGGLPFLNLKCLDRDGGFRRSGLKRYTGDFKDIHVAKKGDIVIAVTDMTQERRIVARAALVPTLDQDFGVFSMDLVRIEPKPGLPKAFLYSLLRYSSFADEVKQHANGANVLHLSPDRITDYRFVSPHKDLMHRFESFVASVIEEIDTLANKIDNLRRTRDLLLPRLLSGQIDVGDVE